MATSGGALHNRRARTRFLRHHPGRPLKNDVQKRKYVLSVNQTSQPRRNTLDAEPLSLLLASPERSAASL